MWDPEATPRLHTQRLVQWNVEMLIQLLKKVVADRRRGGKAAHKSAKTAERDFAKRKEGATFLDEVAEIIALPSFDRQKANENNGKTEEIELDEEVEQQICNFVSCIAASYRNNPFHNFEQ